ncbi:MAG: cobalamin biosynthesis protein [Rhizobiales bacterium]|nr:cobalamin biosynthesis protein [Hyphomicrobiales bacterium]
MWPWREHLIVAVIALALDALFGDPDWIWRRLAHPVVLIGGLIAGLDRWFNRENWSRRVRKAMGILVVLLLIAIAGLAGHLIEISLRQTQGSYQGSRFVPIVALGLIASVFLAQQSLYRHVARVRSAFATGGLAAAREAVSMIVGRDPESLDESGVARAAIESCAENFSDGVVAPAVWLALLGLPGLIVYKAINTADSMIGHRTPRHRDFGWAAARLDDLLNLVPARLAGLLIALAAPVARGSIVASLRTVRRDARKHRSPNAGWPESAMAGALGIALAGPRRYGEAIVDDPFLNADARKDATSDDIGRALKILIAACTLEFAVYAALLLL